MKKILLILLVATLVFACSCAAPTEKLTTPTNSVDTAKWSQYSDYELLKLTIKSEQNEFRQFSAVQMTAEEWKEYMLENCESFRALMLRDTALKSIEEYARTVVEQYQGDLASFRRENFVLLITTVHPEMQEQFMDFEFTFQPRTDE